MTPRTVVVSAQQEKSAKDFHNEHPNLRFSRVPVYSDGPDHVIGYVLKDQILKQLVDQQGDAALSSIRRDIIAVKETYPIPELFEHFTEKREHIALVVDEFGGMAGIVTMEDVIETLLGLEIVDEQDGTADMQALARQRWEQRAKGVGLITGDQET